jgi:hypothetical protein
VKTAREDFPDLAGPPGVCFFTWDSDIGVVQRPRALREDDRLLRPVKPTRAAAEAVKAAGGQIDLGLPDGEVGAAFAALRKTSGDAAVRSLCVFALGALDEASTLLDVLNDADPARAADRGAATVALQHSAARGLAEGRRLYDARSKSGAFIDKGLTPGDAETALRLLHRQPPGGEAQPRAQLDALVALLDHKDSVALRELAFRELERLADAVRLPDYNAAWPAERRRLAAAEIQKVIR